MISTQYVCDEKMDRWMERIGGRMDECSRTSFSFSYKFFPVYNYGVEELQSNNDLGYAEL